MPSIDFVDGSDALAVAVNDRHVLDHKIKQRSSFRAIIGMLKENLPDRASNLLRCDPVESAPKCGNRPSNQKIVS